MKKFKMQLEGEQSTEKLLERQKRFGNQLNKNAPKNKISLSTINSVNDVSYSGNRNIFMPPHR